MGYYFDVKKLAQNLGFPIYYETFDRKNNKLGYIYKGDVNILSVKKVNDKAYERYLIALALVHYLESENKEDFYYEITSDYQEDSEIKLVADLLIPNRIYKLIPKKHKNMDYLSKFFNVPDFVAENKISKSSGHRKIYSKK